MTGVYDAGLRVVVDCAGGTTSLVLPGLLGKIGVDVLTVNNRLDESSPTQSVAAVRADMHRLAELVSSFAGRVRGQVRPGRRAHRARGRQGLAGQRRPRAAGGAGPDRRRARAAAGWRCRSPRPGWPRRSAGTTVSRSIWTPTSLHALYEAAAEPDMIFAADGNGGFVVPGFSRSIDGIAAFAQLLGLVARTRLTLSQIEVRIPEANLLKRSMPTPWAAKGMVMRTVVEAAGDKDHRHHRRRPGDRAGPGLDPGAARSVGGGDASVGGGQGRRHRPGSAG